MDTGNWIAIDDRTWRQEEADVRFFLLTGTERALLIDTGMHTQDAREQARKITQLPLSLINTHADRDHVSSNDEFEQVLVSPFELCHPEMRGRTSDEVIPVWDGDVIDLGERELEVIALPGHTPGSIAILDHETGNLFSGDPIQENGRIFMFGPLRSLAAYVISLERLLTRSQEIRAIWPCHGDCPLDIDVVPKLIQGMRRIETGSAVYTLEQVFGHTVRAYDIGVSVVLTNDEE